MTSPAVHMVASGGGHLDLLRAIARGLDPALRLVWCTTPGRGLDSLRAGGAEAHAIPPIDSDTLGPAAVWLSTRRSLGLVARTRPSIVITSGAGLAAPFCLTARATGARLLFVETMARIGDASKAARLLSRVADTTLVQWPESTAALPAARVCRPLLLADAQGGAPPAGAGTYVSLGTHHAAFPRLLEMVDDAARAGVLPAPILVQAGRSAAFAPRAPAVQVTEWLSSAEVDRALRSSAVIVAQAAAGIASSALRAGRRPLLLAREAERGEHVDDHQRQIATKLDDLGLAVHLGGAIRASDVDRALLPIVLPDALRTGPTLVDEVTRFLHGR